MKRWTLLNAFLLLSLLSGLILAGCGGPASPVSTPLPTATATPRSTPLPPVPTAVPLASEDSPLIVLMRPEGTRRSSASSAQALGDLIQELTGLVVEIELVDSYGEISTRLCGAEPVAGWLDGLTYGVAARQGGADPALQVERDDATGYRVDLLMSAELAGDETTVEDIGALAGQTFCRLSSEDVATWLVPGLMLQAAGVDPLYGLEGVLDVADSNAIISAIYNDECQAGAVPNRYFPNRASSELRALEDLRDKVVAAQSSPELPYGILLYSQTVPLNVRIPLTDVFFQIAASSEHEETLAAILQQDSLERVDESDFVDLRAFLQSSGLDLILLGE